MKQNLADDFRALKYWHYNEPVCVHVTDEEKEVQSVEKCLKSFKIGAVIGIVKI